MYLKATVQSGMVIVRAARDTLLYWIEACRRKKYPHSHTKVLSPGFRAKERVCTGGGPQREGGSILFTRDRSVGSKITSFETLKAACT